MADRIPELRNDRVQINRHPDGKYSAFGKPAHMKSGSDRVECCRCLQLVGKGCAETIGWRISVPGHRVVRLICLDCIDLNTTDEPAPLPARKAKPAKAPRAANTVEQLRAVFDRAQDAVQASRRIAYVWIMSEMRAARDAEEEGGPAAAAQVLRDRALPKVQDRLAHLRDVIGKIGEEARYLRESDELEQIAADLAALIDHLTA